MQVIRLARTAAALVFSALPMAAFADPGYYKVDFTQPVPGFETFAMERYDGNITDGVWTTDTYKHTGPFTYTQGPNGLAIATQGYWEWDYCTFVLPSTVHVQPGDSLKMEMRVAPGSAQDSAWVELQMGRSEKQSEDAVISPNPLASLVKGDWVTVSIPIDVDDTVTHLFVNIDAGYTTGPTSGWWSEPNAAFSGTVEIKNLSLDGNQPGVGIVKVIGQADARARIDGGAIRYLGGNKDNKITVFDMSGQTVGSARSAFAFSRNLKSGWYFYRISEGNKRSIQGKFFLLQ